MNTGHSTGKDKGAQFSTFLRKNKAFQPHFYRITTLFSLEYVIIRGQILLGTQPSPLPMTFISAEK
ncbi:hypothetical protein [Cellvibrio polysaccharolyticus]|uniref:hypothetical protein n=1 Tax=Cellvibrio polysaccharolyticus TaxID=2082724 RepID=UPI00187F891B|nr:hypothetical protein [Cellvibrio polysaccharolyticus]